MGKSYKERPDKWNNKNRNKNKPKHKAKKFNQEIDWKNGKAHQYENSVDDSY